MYVEYLLLKLWQSPFDRAIQCLFKKIKPGDESLPGFSGMIASRGTVKNKNSR
jgi:hypothetical protein